MPTSMVLRFRDLVAKTVEQHLLLIEKYGYVWWGWWNKPDEKIPRSTFASFEKVIASEKRLFVFLVDSGNSWLYRASLVDIKIPSDETFIDCPEPEKTPTYYAAGKYMAWFKLTSIERVRDDEI